MTTGASGRSGPAWRGRRHPPVLAVAAFVVALCAAPFITTWLNRAFDVPGWAPWAVIGAGVLLAIPRGPLRWAGAGLVAGAVAFQVFLFWLFATWGDGSGL